MKTFLLVLFFFVFIFSHTTFAQDGKVFEKRNAFFLEGGGKGPFYSINYDRIVRQRAKLSWSLRVGFSIVPDGIAMPLAINAFTTPGNHHFEFGLGLTPFIQAYQSFLAKDDKSDKYLYIIPSAGYRYQKPEGGLFFTATLTPLIFLDPPSYDVFDVEPELIPSGGIGIGFSF